MRLVAALLTVLAAFAFPLRAPPPVAHMSGMEGHHPAPGPSHRDQHSGEHAAHCLFCLTGAFALAAEPPPALPALARQFSDSLRSAPHFAAAPLPLPEARAPPTEG